MKHLEGRNKEMVRMYREGKTFTDISAFYGITRQRAFQIVKSTIPTLAENTDNTIDKETVRE